MRFNVPKWSRLAVLGIVATSMSSVGCSGGSGWKMPSTKMFSWSKKPSETTLAGAGPSAINYPVSPATKQAPQQIASAAAGNTPAAKVGTGTPSYAANGAASAKPTQPTYTPPNGMSNVAFAPPAAASVANGYAVGPYNTYSQPGAAAGALANAGVPNRVPSGMAATGMAPGNPFNTANNSASSMPSTQVYGGAAASPAFASRPPASGPGSFQAAPPQGTQVSAPAGLAANGFSVPQSMPMTGGYSPVGTQATHLPSMNTPPASLASYPGAGAPGSAGMMPPGSTGLPASFPGYSGSSTVPAQMAAYNSMPNTGGYAAPGLSSPNQAAGQAPSSQEGLGNAGPFSTASFRPGSTGRQTNYSFGQPAPQSGLASQGTGTTGGPAASTANSTSNPSFQVPPNTTYR